MIRLKKGQRWQWEDGNDSTIVEILEDTSFNEENYSAASCIIVQRVSGYKYGAVGKMSHWGFGSYMKFWTYLEGQDAP